MRAVVKVKGLQDADHFAVGAVGEDVGVGAPHAHFPSRQPLQPGQESAAQSRNLGAVDGGGHEDGGEQRDGNGHQPHVPELRGREGSYIYIIIFLINHGSVFLT